MNAEAAALASARLCRLNYDPTLSEGEILKAHRDWARRHAEPSYPVGARCGLATPDTSPERPLRVGYVSADLRRHPVALFVEPILRGHDRAAVQPFCYDTSGARDDLNAHLRGLVPAWRDAAGWSDEALAERIREDAIDILVDLNGHTAGNRLLVFARKPAPVQVTGIGYVTTTGLRTMDYRLTDAWCDPPELDHGGYSETLWRLPFGFDCYVPPRGLPEPSPPPCLDGRSTTFGSFNNLDKISDQVIDIWARILRKTPGSRLLMKTRSLSEPDVRRRLLERFAAGGIDAGRLELIEWSETLAEHFDHYRRVDIALDPFPYNGTTTTCETLMMGVPVIALRGDRHAGRVSFSILARLGLSGLSAADPETYVSRAVALARSPDALAKLRANLRRRMIASPVCDAHRYTPALEDAYRDMWRRFVKLTAAA